MAVNEPALVGALVASKVPDTLITGVVSALTEDFSYSKEVVADIDEIVKNLGDAPLVTDLFLKIKEYPTLPQGLSALITWLEGGGVEPLAEAEILNAVEVAIKANEHWWVQIDPWA